MPYQGRIFPTLCGRSSSRTKPSPTRSTVGRGRNGARAAVTPQAPAPGPPLPCGVENVLCRLKWHRSKPASRARVMPRIPFALAWSYAARPPASWTIADEGVDVGVEDPGVLRVRDQQRRRPLADRCPERVERRPAEDRVGVQGDHPVAGHLRRRGVRGMAEDRRDDLVAPPGVTARGVVGPNHGDVGVDRRRAGPGLERHAVHPGDLAEHPLEVPEDLEDALDGGRILERVEVGKLRAAHELVVDLRRVLHRAGALPDVDVEVDAQVLLREARVVAHDVDLGQLGQRGRGGAAGAGR